MPERSDEEKRTLLYLEVERALIPSDSVRNHLKGDDLNEYYFVWSLLYSLHPSGEELEEWWRYANINEALSVVQQAYSDPFSRYIQPEIARLFLQDRGSTTDTTVFLEWPAETIPLIQITEFRLHSIGVEHGDTTGTWSEFRSALQKSAESEATILDLRGNPGGETAICTAIADEFVDEGVLYIERNYWANVDYTVPFVRGIEATKGGFAVGRRWVILQDSMSASCAELLLIALKGNKVGTSVGTTSYGKGIGQTYFLTPLEGILSVTTFETLGNDSLSFHSFGIPPDHEEASPKAQLELALQLAQPAPPPPLLTRDRGETPAVDQLQERLQQRRSRSSPSADAQPFYRFREAAFERF